MPKAPVGEPKEVVEELRKTTLGRPSQRSVEDCLVEVERILSSWPLDNVSTDTADTDPVTTIPLLIGWPDSSLSRVPKGLHLALVSLRVCLSSPILYALYTHLTPPPLSSSLLMT